MRFITLSIIGLARVALHALTALLPRRKNLAVFGAWDGDQYCDNPKYMMLYLLEHSDYECVWVGKEHLRSQMPQHKNFRFVVYGSWTAVFYAMRAKFIFTCQKDEDVADVSWQGGALRFNLWHGIPLKYMGEKTPFQNMHLEKRGTLRQIRHSLFVHMKPSPRWTVSASRKMSDILVSSYPGYFSSSRILEVGTPRNDYILKNLSNEKLRMELKRKYCLMFGVPVDRKIVLYMPTWRMRQMTYFTFAGMDLNHKDRIKQILQNSDAVLIEKHHKAALSDLSIESNNDSNIVVAGNSLYNDIDPQELYLITDVLITDYSSAYIDFALLHRPCIHFVYDYDEYRSQDSGLAYDLSEVAAGPCVKTLEEVEDALQKALVDSCVEQKPEYHELVEFENGNCCEQISEFMGGK